MEPANRKITKSARRSNADFPSFRFRRHFVFPPSKSILR
jgi:hypothetical protein